MNRKDILLIDGGMLVDAINIDDQMFDVVVNRILKSVKNTTYNYNKIVILIDYTEIKNDDRHAFKEKLYKYIIKNNWDNLSLIDIEKVSTKREDVVIKYIIFNPDITSFKLIGSAKTKYSFIPKNKIIKLEF